MKLAESTRNVKVSGAENISDFGVSQEGMPILMEIMSNKIYSDKPMAVIREYSCNAADANTENGKADTPIHVTLPNRMEPVLKIRDTGKGLSFEEIMETYIQYGTSTKRGSNNMIGCLGLGSKSGFAYGDSFVITSWNDGVKSVYSAFRGADKTFKMAALGKPEKDASDSGIEIQIPIRNEDVGTIVTKALTFFQHWDVRPTFSGADMNFKKQPVVIEGVDWKILESDHYSYGSECQAVMGKIAYPINLKMMSSDNFANEDWAAIRYMVDGACIIIQFNIGDIEINAGRESLEYTELTQKALGAALVRVSEELAAMIQKEMSDCKTMFECKKFYAQAFRHGGKYQQYARFLRKDALRFKGNPVKEPNWDLGLGSDVDYKNGFEAMLYQKNNDYGYRRRHLTQIRSGTAACKVPAQDDMAYIVNETGASQGVLTRIVPLLERDENYCKKKQAGVFLFNIKDKAKFDKWAKENNFDAPMLKLEDLPKVKLNEIYPPSQSNAKVYSKHKSKVFLLKLNHQYDYGDPKSQSFEEITIDMDTSTDLYVIIDRFMVKGAPNTYSCSDTSPREIRSLLKGVCQFLGLKDVPRIVAVRDKHKKTLGKNMTNLFTWMRSQVTSLAIKEKLADKLKCYQVGSEMFSDEYGLESLVKAVSGLTTGPLQQLSEMVKRGDKAEARRIKDFDIYCSKLDIKQNAKHADCKKEAETLLSEAQELYPMLFMANSSAYAHDWDRNKDSVIQYIKMVDKFHGGSENEGEHAYVLSGSLPLTPLILIN